MSKNGYIWHCEQMSKLNKTEIHHEFEVLMEFCEYRVHLVWSSDDFWIIHSRNEMMILS